MPSRRVDDRIRHLSSRLTDAPPDELPTILQKLLATPAARSALVLGKALPAGVRGLTQAGIIYLLALMLHIPVRFEVGAIAASLMSENYGDKVG